MRKDFRFCDFKRGRLRDLTKGIRAERVARRLHKLKDFKCISRKFSILILAIRNGASLFGGKYFYTLLINTNKEQFLKSADKKFDEPRNKKKKKDEQLRRRLSKVLGSVW